MHSLFSWAETCADKLSSRIPTIELHYCGTLACYHRLSWIGITIVDLHLKNKVVCVRKTIGEKEMTLNSAFLTIFQNISMSLVSV